MNEFGRIFRVSMFGESHGPAVGALIDGCPAGIKLTVGDFYADIERRKAGKKGTTTRAEADEPKLVSGVFEGRTSGAPILVMFENNDVDSAKYEKMKNLPRPGHADFVARQKFGGFSDYRGGGHFSGRLTVALVAAGVVAKKTVPNLKISAKLISAGGKTDIEKAVEEAVLEHDSVGGIVECRVSGLAIGLGEPFFDSVESVLSHILFSIPAIKGVEFGAGFASASMKGSKMNDELTDKSGKTKTNNAGGINGGLTNGNELVVRVAVKPTSSIGKEQEFVDMKNGEKKRMAIVGRHDACIALRAPVVVEAAVAIGLADLMMIEQKTGKV